MKPALEIVVSATERSERVDLYLFKRLPSREKGLLHLSRSRIQRLISEGLIRVNARETKPSYRVHPGDRICVQIPPPQSRELAPEEIPLEIVYEDQFLVIVNKPPGMVVHPAPGNPRGTLVNALLAHCQGLSGIGGRERPGIVHRLDKETSGLLVAAKTDPAHQGLIRQFRSREVLKVYTALVAGDVRPGKGQIDLPIGRDLWERKKFSPRTTRPKEAVTHFRVLERFGSATLLEVRPMTGRTHQIRVHLNYIKHPILGDKTYGGHKACRIGEYAIPRLLLHAGALGLTHPVTGRYSEFTVPLPPDMQEVISFLRARGLSCRVD